MGRTKELILCSGYNVYPSEVEDLLDRHPAIAEAAVIGIPDAYSGESPKAFIVLKSDHRGKIKEEEIVGWCKENMAAYKRPRVVEGLKKSILNSIYKFMYEDRTSISSQEGI